MATWAYDRLRHFHSVFQRCFICSHQTCQKWSSSIGSEKVLYLFGVIWNPRWLSWSLIVQHIFHIFFQEDCMLNHQTYQKLSCRRIWRCVATFCTDLESKMATGTMASYWPRHFAHFFYYTNMYMNSPDFLEILFWRSVVTFWNNSK